MNPPGDYLIDREAVISILREMGPTIGREATVHTLKRLGFDLDRPGGEIEMQRDMAWVRDTRTAGQSLRARFSERVLDAGFNFVVTLIGLGLIGLVAVKSGVVP